MSDSAYNDNALLSSFFRVKENLFDKVKPVIDRRISLRSIDDTEHDRK